jgi:CheY-like chemotaxis protein
MRVASDGEEALRILRPGAGRDGHVAPDVILLDLNLPGIDGRDVLQAIKREPPISRVPVIALIGSAAEIDVLHDLEADSYIVKPSGFDQLQQIVAAIESYRPSVVARPNGVKLGKSGAC